MLNMAKMKEKYQQLKEGPSNKKNDPLNWKPEDGKQDIRIVCPEDGDPFREVWVHYRIGDEAPFLCPKKNFGDKCAVCDFAWSLYEEGDTKSAKELLPASRYLSPIVVRGEETPVVKIWNYSKTVYKSLMDYIFDPEYGDITDVSEGFDLTLAYDAEAARNRQSATTLRPKRNPSALAESKEETQRIFDTMPNFQEKYAKKNSEDCEKILENFLGSSEGNETQKYGNSDTKSDNATDVDRVFQEMGLQ